jgi:hypothetical protein
MYQSFRLLLNALAVVIVTTAITACGVVTGTIPKDFPLPIYPNSSAQMDGYHELMGGKSLILTSGDGIEAIHQYYLDKMRADGWHITGDRKVENSYSVYAERGKENSIVLVRPDAIILTWTSHKK